MKGLAIAAVGLALVVAMGGSSRGAAQSPPPPAIVSQACSVAHPGSIAVTFSWPKPPGALQTWVDLSLFDNGFLPDTFLAEGPIPPATTSFTWDGIAPGLPHFYRVNALYPDGWYASPTGTFVPGLCPGLTAERLSVAEGCDFATETASVTFTWKPASGGGGAQWLDLSLFSNGFAPGTFVSVGPLPAGVREFTWKGLATVRTHYWRVNTYSYSRWWPSVRGSFLTSYCQVPIGGRRYQDLPPPVGDCICYDCEGDLGEAICPECECSGW